MIELLKKNRWILFSELIIFILLLNLFLITRNNRIIYSLYTVQVLVNFCLLSVLFGLGVLLYFKLLKAIPTIVLLGFIAVIYLLFGFFTLGLGGRLLYSLVGVILILSTHIFRQKDIKYIWIWLVVVLVYFILGAVFFRLFQVGTLSILHVLAFILAFLYLMDVYAPVKYLKQIYFTATLVIPLFLLFFIGVFASSQFVKGEEDLAFYEISINDTTYLVKEELEHTMMDTFINISIYEEIRFGIYHRIGGTTSMDSHLYHLTQDEYTFLAENEQRIKVTIETEELEFWINLN